MTNKEIMDIAMQQSAYDTNANKNRLPLLNCPITIAAYIW